MLNPFSTRRTAAFQTRHFTRRRGAFDPLSVFSGVEGAHFLDASRESGYSDGDNIGAGGPTEYANGNSWGLQGTPQWVDGANGIGGKPAFKFVAADSEGVFSDDQVSPHSGSDKPYTAMAIVRASSVAGFRDIIDIVNSSLTNPLSNVRIKDSQWRFARRDDSGASVVYDRGTAATGTNYVLASVFSGTSIVMRVNASEIMDETANVGVTTLDRIRVGYESAAIGNHFDGLIAVACLYPGVLPDATIQKIERSWANKYGITLA